MTDNPTPKRSGRPQLLLVALVFLLPLVAAMILYYGGERWRPAGSTNHGMLLSPIVNLHDAVPGNALKAGVDDYWALLYVGSSRCDAGCRDALFTLRQARLMLGNDMNRLKRVFLHGPDAPDTLFLDSEHRGTIALHEPGITSMLDAVRPAEAGPGGFFLLDPLGNLVMYFPAGIVPRDMVDDLAHLLDLSRIG